MVVGGRARLPRDTTAQAKGLRYGHAHKRLNRWAAIVILAFLLLHLLGQASVRVELLAGLGTAVPFLSRLQHEPAVRAVLFASIAFHFLHSLKLIAMDLGLRVGYRKALWTVSAVSVVVFVRELASYAGF